MRIEHKKILEDYANIKKEMNVLENKADEMKIEVLQIMQENELGEVEIGLDKISIGSRRSWIYPEELKAAEKELKSKQKESQQLGTASYKENFYPIFTDSDNKKEKKVYD